MMSAKFHHDQPRCHGNQNLGQNRLQLLLYHGLCGSNKLLYKRWALSIGKGKIRPHTAPTFVDRSPKLIKKHARQATHMPNFVKIGLRGWASRTPSLSHVLVIPFVFRLCIIRTASWSYRWTDYDARWLIGRVFRQDSACWWSRWWQIM